MAVKAMNFKMEESEIRDLKKVAGVYNMSLTELIKNAIREYLAELKTDPFYRLTANVQEADAAESREVLDKLEELSDEDLEIVSTKKVTI